MRKRRAGFSLIELVIVVLVLGILAGVAAPRYANAVRWQHLEAATRRIAADLRLARDEAVRISTNRTIQFTPVDNKYTLVGVADPDHPDKPYEVDLANTGYPVTLANADFNGGATITFDIYGRPDNAGVVTVQSGAETRVVNVSAAGHITLP